MKNVLASLSLAILGAVAAEPASAAIVLSFNPQSSHINIGQTVVIDVSISGLGAEVLSAYDLNFVWNSAVVEWRSGDFTSLVSQLGAGAEHNFNSLAQGNFGVDGFSNLLDPDLSAFQANAFLLASFTLEGMTDGAINFTLGSDLDFERNLVGLNFGTLTVDVGAACIAVGTGVCSRLPEPSSFGLVGLAIAGLLVPAARRRRVATAEV